MIIEERLSCLTDRPCAVCKFHTNKGCNKWKCVFEEALEQEPCEDAISRQAVKEQMIKYGFNAPDMTVTEFVEGLPSVSTEKIGRWIDSNGVDMFVCSVCNESFYPMPTCLGKPLMKYCPSCGAKMEVE